MFRIKLFVAIVLLLLPVLLLAVFIYLSQLRAEYHLQRNHLAHSAALAYVTLSHDAYRHFKTLTDGLALHDPSDPQQRISTSRQRLDQSIKQAEAAIRAEIRHVSQHHWLHDENEDDETEELLEVAEIVQVLHLAIANLEQSRVLYHQGQHQASHQLLERTLEQTINQQFKVMIDAEIANELLEVTYSTQHAYTESAQLKQLAWMTALLVMVFAVWVAWYLWRSFNGPLKVLLQGVRAVAKGKLDARIELEGRNEFTYLAKNFNQMTEQLVIQHQALLDAQANLEWQVKERTYELQQANDSLTQLNQSRQKFFADISHELRTPLTAIRGEAEVTLRGRQTSEVDYREALKRVIELSGQLTQQVDDLLFLARSENAAARFNMASLDLAALVVQCCDNAKALATRQGLQLLTRVPTTRVLLMGDEQRLRQLLLILLDNACRYTPAHGGPIWVTLEQGVQQLRLSVHSHSSPIAPEDLKRVFDRHYRGEQARLLAPQGSGLGLAVAREIVTAHRGRIVMNSSVEAGTTVTVLLPPWDSQEES